MAEPEIVHATMKPHGFLTIAPVHPVLTLAEAANCNYKKAACSTFFYQGDSLILSGIFRP